jgi:hypothetical protein
MPILKNPPARRLNDKSLTGQAVIKDARPIIFKAIVRHSLIPEQSVI